MLKIDESILQSPQIFARSSDSGKLSILQNSSSFVCRVTGPGSSKISGKAIFRSSNRSILFCTLLRGRVHGETKIRTLINNVFKEVQVKVIHGKACGKASVTSSDGKKAFVGFSNGKLTGFWICDDSWNVISPNLVDAAKWNSNSENYFYYDPLSGYKCSTIGERTAIIEFSNGASYTGQFRIPNKFSGIGVYSYPGYPSLQGKFSGNGPVDAQGIFIKPKVGAIEGIWKNKIGKGTIKFKTSGDIYLGEMKSSFPQGIGILMSRNGCITRGFFKCGVIYKGYCETYISNKAQKKELFTGHFNKQGVKLIEFNGINKRQYIGSRNIVQLSCVSNRLMYIELYCASAYFFYPRSSEHSVGYNKLTSKICHGYIAKDALAFELKGTAIVILLDNSIARYSLITRQLTALAV